MAVLPDLLADGLTTVFCGSAAGKVSAQVGLPYAGPGNKFWPILAETGLTPHRFQPSDYRSLLGLGIGLTDVNKTQSGADSDLTSAGDDPDAVAHKVRRHRPAILAFTAKRPAQVFMAATFGRRELSYGPQEETIDGTRIFVLPSPSGLAIRWWEPRWWHDLADMHRAALTMADAGNAG